MKVTSKSCSENFCTAFLPEKASSASRPSGVLPKSIDLEEAFSLLENTEEGEVILVVDDDPDFVDSLTELLSRRNRRVVGAHTGPEAIEKVEAGGISVLILDLRLPVLDGLEVYIELKRRGRVLPTIVVTAYTEEESDKIQLLVSVPAGLSTCGGW